MLINNLFKVYHPTKSVGSPIVQGPGNDPAAVIILVIVLVLIGIGIYYLVKISKKKKF